MTLLDKIQTLTNNVCRANGVDPNNGEAIIKLAEQMNDNRKYITIHWDKPLAKYGNYLHDITKGSEASKTIAFIKMGPYGTNNEVTYASPYTSGDFEIELGTAIHLRMIAGTSSELSNINVLLGEESRDDVGCEESELNVSFIPTHNGTLELIDEQYVTSEDGTYYTWNLQYKPE